jgi:hypothetical protein
MKQQFYVMLLYVVLLHGIEQLWSLINDAVIVLALPGYAGALI